jgi:transcriptional regulator with XRE-family HTH domain
VDGRRLAEFRRAAGLSQWELAKLADLSPRAISLIETGRRSGGIRASTVQRLARALGITIDELLSEPEPEGVAS